MLSIVAMRGMRELGTPGVQLWDPGRAFVCFTLSDLGSPEGLFESVGQAKSAEDLSIGGVR